MQKEVYKKHTDTGLLLHYQSHVDRKYKHGLLVTRLNCTFRLSSSWRLFDEECNWLKKDFTKLLYPTNLFDSTVNHLIQNQVNKMKDEQTRAPEADNVGEALFKFILPFKDQSQPILYKISFNIWAERLEKTLLQFS